MSSLVIAGLDPTTHSPPKGVLRRLMSAPVNPRERDGCRAKSLCDCVTQINSTVPAAISAASAKENFEPNAPCIVLQGGNKVTGWNWKPICEEALFRGPPTERERMIDRFENGANEHASAAEAGARQKTGHGKAARRHPAILRVSSIGVAGLLSALMVTAVAPPIVAD